MYVIVAYDISDDYRRDRAAKRLLAMGYQRIQRSLYVAKGGVEKARRTAAALRPLINPDTDKIHIIIVPDYSWQKRIELGEAEPPGTGPKPGIHLA